MQQCGHTELTPINLLSGPLIMRIMCLTTFVQLSLLFLHLIMPSVIYRHIFFVPQWFQIGKNSRETQFMSHFNPIPTVHLPEMLIHK